MDKVFLDSDVILDFLLGREPFAKDAARILSLCERKSISACSTGLVFANVYYVLRKISSHKKVSETLLELTQLVDCIPLSKSAVTRALHADFNDFEDALQHFSALESDINVILTRNLKDYKHSTLSVQSPEMFLRFFSGI